jgi:hypothetical protein
MTDALPTAQLFYGFPVRVENIQRRIPEYCKVKTNFLEQPPSPPSPKSAKIPNRFLKRMRSKESLDCVAEWRVARFFPHVREPSGRQSFTAGKLTQRLEDLVEPLFMDIEAETGIKLRVCKMKNQTGLISDAFVTVSDHEVMGSGNYLEVEIVTNESMMRALFLASNVLGTGTERIGLCLAAGLF